MNSHMNTTHARVLTLVRTSLASGIASLLACVFLPKRWRREVVVCIRTIYPCDRNDR